MTYRFHRSMVLGTDVLDVIDELELIDRDLLIYKRYLKRLLLQRP